VGVVRGVGYNSCNLCGVIRTVKDDDTVELVLSDVGNKWRRSRCGTVEVR